MAASKHFVVVSIYGFCVVFFIFTLLTFFRMHTPRHDAEKFQSLIRKMNDSKEWNGTYNFLQKRICGNRKLIMYIQSHQMNRVVSGLHINSKDALVIAHKNPDTDYFNETSLNEVDNFYGLNEGALNVQLPLNAKGYKTLMLYNNKQCKLIDDFIFKLLIALATSGSTMHCFPNQCSSLLIKNRNNFLESESKKERGSTFAFTFVRHPILRFISAVTEIEYRMKHLNKGALLETNIEQEFQHKLGTPNRFMEFIRLLLLLLGRESVMSKLGSIEINHVMPMIGPILGWKEANCQSLKNDMENESVHRHDLKSCERMPQLYKLESFQSEWERLVSESDYDILSEAPRNFSKVIRRYSEHDSSHDPYKTTLSAKSFLSYANNDIIDLFSTKTANFSMLRQPVPSNIDPLVYQSQAKRYLRGICRIYLVDFICAGYALPTDCADILNDIQESLPDLSWTIDKWDGSQLLCSNFTMIADIQKQQLERAGDEVLESSPAAPISHKHVHEFYNYSIGYLEVIQSSSTKKYQNLEYLRILKNGNDAIRSLLFVAFTLDMNLKDSKTALQCISSKCQHPRISEFKPEALLRHYKPANEVRFPLLFVMEPSRKVVSLLAHDSAGHIRDSGEVAKDVQSFIDGLLHDFQPSSFKYKGIDGFRPFIGSLLLARDKETEDVINLYDAENVATEWQRLRGDLSIDMFPDIYTALIKALPHPQKVVDMKIQEAIDLVPLGYRISLCRVYLTDYICGGFQLPEYCERIVLSEVVEDINVFYTNLQSKIPWYKNLWIHLRSIIPRSILINMATLFCRISLDVSCFDEIVYSSGDSLDRE